MENKQKAFQQKVKNRKFALDNFWRSIDQLGEASIGMESGDSAGQDRHVWNSLEENLYTADLHKVNTGYFLLHSRFKRLGKVIIFVKKIIRKLIKILLGWYIFPIFNHQNIFNGKLMNVVSLERELLVRMEKRIAELEITNQKLCAELASVKKEGSEQLAAEIKFRDVAFDVIGDRVGALNTKLLQEADAWRQEQASQKTAVESLNSRLLQEADAWRLEKESQKATVENLSIALQREEEDRKTRLSILNENIGELGSKLDRIENLPTSDDEFYHHFEEKFRGSREEIRNRLEVYIPLIKERLPDWSQARFIDIGSGRGEWLDILRNHGATDYVGVDLNKKQNAICESNGHKTVCADCIEYLKAQADESVDLISGIQIIEHLYMSELMELLKESHRVLKKGGMILFETPNPRNVVVGAGTFYTDPSHKRPLEPGMVGFLAEWSGFKNIRCVDANAHPLWEGPPLPEPNSENYELVKQFNDVKWLLYGPMDYALFAVKE